jgi:hypothetical protein
MRFRDLQGSLRWQKIFITIFELIGQFSFQNNVFQLQEVFSELEIRVFLENGLGSFQTFLILQIRDKPQVLKRFQNQFENKTRNRRNQVYFGFRKKPCGFFPKPLN